MDLTMIIILSKDLAEESEKQPNSLGENTD